MQSSSHIENESYNDNEKYLYIHFQWETDM